MERKVKSAATMWNCKRCNEVFAAHELKHGYCPGCVKAEKAVANEVIEADESEQLCSRKLTESTVEEEVSALAFKDYCQEIDDEYVKEAEMEKKKEKKWCHVCDMYVIYEDGTCNICDYGCERPEGEAAEQLRNRTASLVRQQTMEMIGELHEKVRHVHMSIVRPVPPDIPYPPDWWRAVEEDLGVLVDRIGRMMDYAMEQRAKWRPDDTCPGMQKADPDE